MGRNCILEGKQTTMSGQRKPSGTGDNSPANDPLKIILNAIQVVGKDIGSIKNKILEKKKESKKNIWQKIWYLIHNNPVGIISAILLAASWFVNEIFYQAAIARDSMREEHTATFRFLGAAYNTSQNDAYMMLAHTNRDSTERKDMILHFVAARTLALGSFLAQAQLMTDPIDAHLTVKRVDEDSLSNALEVAKKKGVEAVIKIEEAFERRLNDTPGKDNNYNYRAYLKEQDDKKFWRRFYTALFILGVVGNFVHIWIKEYKDKNEND